LRTGSPLAIGATAILCPRSTRARAVTPAADAPSAIGSTATTTLSFGERRTVRGLLMISPLGSARTQPGGVRVAAIPCWADDGFVHTHGRRKFRHIDNQVSHVLRLDHARALLRRDRLRAQIEDRRCDFGGAQHGRADAVLELLHVDR